MVLLFAQARGQGGLVAAGGVHTMIPHITFLKLLEYILYNFSKITRIYTVLRSI